MYYLYWHFLINNKWFLKKEKMELIHIKFDVESSLSMRDCLLAYESWSKIRKTVIAKEKPKSFGFFKHGKDNQLPLKIASHSMTNFCILLHSVSTLQSEPKIIFLKNVAFVHQNIWEFHPFGCNFKWPNNISNLKFSLIDFSFF